ncbi:MAG: bifunctional DedA family/phosphatase PAP2 family protein [Gemmatimonadaceae bacterium]
MLSHLISTYGYVIVALLVTLEGFGVPVPGETALVTAAALAANGKLDIAGVILASSLGTVLGGSGGYWIGRTGGLALVLRYGRFVRLDAAKLETARGFFGRHGSKTVFLGRFVALLRILAAILAGVTEMPFGRFTLYNAAGGIAWTLVFATLGFIFGKNLPRLERTLGRATGVLAIAGAIAVVVFLAWRYVRAHADELWRDEQSLWKRTVARPGLQRRLSHFPRLRGFLAARFTPGEALGLHLTLGLMISVLALIAFTLITKSVVGGRSLARLDLRLAAQLHRSATPAGILFARVFSILGALPAMYALGLSVGAVLLVKGQRLPLVGWFVGLGGGGLLTTLLKFLIHRPRPAWSDPYASEPTWAFPSGHASGAIIGYGLVAYFLALLVKPRWLQVSIVVAATLLVVGIGWSRLYLGVHYFSDVVSGFAAGGLWLSIVVSGLEVARRGSATADAGARNDGSDAALNTQT